MVTAQGIAAGLGVPFIVAWSRRVNRRKLLVTLLAVPAVGNLITSVAPNYPLILGTRLIMRLRQRCLLGHRCHHGHADRRRSTPTGPPPS